MRQGSGHLGMLVYRLLFPASQLTKFPISAHPKHSVNFFESPPPGHTYVFDFLFRQDDARDQFMSWDGAKCAHIDAWPMPDSRFLHLVAHIVPDRPFRVDSFFFDTIRRLHDVHAAGSEAFAQKRIAAWTTAEGGSACADIAAEGLFRSKLTDEHGNEVITDASMLHNMLSRR